jgi:hypothetical protein
VVVVRCRSGRWLHADWGYRLGVVREREEREKREIKARLLGSLLFLVSIG